MMRLTNIDVDDVEWQYALAESHANIGPLLKLNGDQPSVLASCRAALPIIERMAA
jgi:hypothetical protein